MVLGIVASMTVFSRNYITSMLIIIIGLILSVLNYFERKTIIVEKIVLIAILSALSSFGRIIFAGVPSIQVSSFIIMMAGLSFGKEIGLMTGVITAIASNLVLGQGPWTPWQMFLWGLMGFLTGLFSKKIKANNWIFIIYGFLWGIVFGWVMNLWYITGYMTDISLEIFILAGLSSLSFDIAHGVSNVILICFTKDHLLHIFQRIAIKYQL